MLFMNHGHDCKEHDQKRGEWQRRLECMAETMLFDDPGKGRCQDDDHQPDQTHLGDVERQGDHQPDRHQGLHDEDLPILHRGPGCQFLVIVDQHRPDRIRQRCAIAKPFQFLQRPAGQQARNKNRQRDRHRLEKELDKVPAGLVCNQQILRLAHLRRYPSQSRSHGGVHHERTQKGPELLEIFPMQQVHGPVLGRVMRFLVALAGGHAVVNLIETQTDGNRDGHDGERIEKGRKYRGGPAEHDGQGRWRTHSQQQAGEYEQQQVTQKIDSRDHEHQQQQNGKRLHDFRVNTFRRGESDEHRFDREEAARLQRIATQGHCQRKNELEQQGPARDNGPGQDQQNRVRHQKKSDRRLVPARRITEKVPCKRLR